MADQPLTDEIEIWPENLETVTAFLACQTQWQVDGMSGQVRGLRYADVAATLEMLGVADRRAVFDGIRVMEAEALRVFGERKN